MSLPEAYRLAHSAQCRLNLEASRPDRNLRFVVGHLMHYESLRLRIVEIEHDISRSQRAKAVQFRGTGDVQGQGLRHKPSTGQLGRKSPPPPATPVDADDDDREDDDEDDDSDADDDYDINPEDMLEDDDDAGLGLTRFPSGSARPPQPPPDLEPDEGDEVDEDDEPISPEEPDQATLELALKGHGSDSLASMYEGVRKCPCHRNPDAPKFERMWELPAQEGQREGITRAVAAVTA
jgi:hypothetical protein